MFDKECNFPFIYDGVTYNECTIVGEPALWCSISTDSSDVHNYGEWGFCLEEQYELAEEVEFSYEHVCSDQGAFVCTAQGNYGAISVDWENSEVMLQVWTPHETSKLAAQHTISLTQDLDALNSWPTPVPSISPTFSPTLLLPTQQPVISPYPTSSSITELSFVMTGLSKSELIDNEGLYYSLIHALSIGLSIAEQLITDITITNHYDTRNAVTRRSYKALQDVSIHVNMNSGSVVIKTNSASLITESFVGTATALYPSMDFSDVEVSDLTATTSGANTKPTPSVVGLLGIVFALAATAVVACYWYFYRDPNTNPNPNQPYLTLTLT